jgi:hypothetical protein
MRVARLPLVDSTHFRGNAHLDADTNVTQSGALPETVQSLPVFHTMR